MIRNEFGGINESFYNLYALTGNSRFLWLARFFYHDSVIGPLKNLDGDFGTMHTNTFIPKVLAEARNYELTASDTSRILSEFFWETVTGRHTFVTGSCSDKEHFFDPDRMSEHLSGLGFRTREGIDLKPLYDTHHRRYIVYWNVVGK